MPAMQFETMSKMLIKSRDEVRTLRKRIRELEAERDTMQQDLSDAKERLGMAMDRLIGKVKR